MTDGIWRAAPPAEKDALAVLKARASVLLPDSYLGQLAISNGGEGDLGAEPGWISLWPAEEVIELNADYEIADSLPGFFGFASNGGGELIAFDHRTGAPFPIVMVPFIPMDVREAIQIARSFDSFLHLIGKRLDDAA
jgi:hypothetical protein